ncbi:MAG: folate-binding protein [Rhodospirillales bacterium]|nr:folate-binding protein [Rhodospirillales bacterium]MDE0380621.1 folate-binding protein [Rhodospirillales bacterium]
MNAPLYVPLEDRGVVSVDGPEAGPFLQGLISNDIERVMDARGIYAALLTPQGKFLHDFFVLRRGAGYLLDCEGARTGDLGQRLMAYRLRADVALADATEDYRVIALFGGDGGESAFDLPAGDGGAAPCAGGTLMRDPRGDALGLRAVLPADAALAFLERAGFARGIQADYERHRIALGAPDGSRDMEVGRATLMECGFEELNGVDFEKGCYVGQELTARTKHRGLVRRRLARVALEGPLPPAGTPIVAGEREVGEIRSGLDGAALAVLRLERIAAAAEAGTPLVAGDARVIPPDSP